LIAADITTLNDVDMCYVEKTKRESAAAVKKVKSETAASSSHETKNSHDTKNKQKSALSKDLMNASGRTASSEVCGYISVSKINLV